MAKATAHPTTNLAISVSDINTTVNCEPRVHDLRLAEALGFTSAYDVRPLIRRHMATLRTFGEVSFKRGKPGERGGRPGTDYWLNKRQALYITAKSDTERAALVTVEMVDVFDAATSGKPVKVQEHHRRRPAQASQEAQQNLPSPETNALTGYTTGQGLFGLFGCACSTVAEWKQAGIVTDNDRAMYIALQAVFDIAGVDADVGRVAGLKRR